jgi:hypothetical protein
MVGTVRFELTTSSTPKKNDVLETLNNFAALTFSASNCIDGIYIYA